MEHHLGFADAVMAEGNLLGPDSPYVNNVECHLHQLAKARNDGLRRDWRGNVDLLLLLPYTLLIIDRHGGQHQIQAAVITEYPDGTVGMWRVRRREDALTFWRETEDYQP